MLQMATLPLVNGTAPVPRNRLGRNYRVYLHEATEGHVMVVESVSYAQAY